MNRGAERRISALDGLRGLAAAGVVVHHVWQYTGHPTAVLGYWWRELALAVALFFCLSGFLVYRPWVRAALDPSRAAPATAPFYVKRAARILPLYWLTLLVSFLVLLGSGHWREVGAPDLLAFAVFAQNYEPGLAGHLDPPMWTLTIEVTFYALLPLIGRLTIRTARTRARQLLAVLVLTVLCVLYAALTIEPPEVQRTLPDVLPLFCAGMAACVLTEGRRVGPWTARALIVSGATLVWLHASGRLGVPLGGALRDLPAGVGFAAICVGCATPAAPRPLGTRPLAHLGTLSFGIYLWHYPVLLLWQRLGVLPTPDVPLALALVGLPAVVLAQMSWTLVEKPVLRLASDRVARDELLRDRGNRVHRPPTDRRAAGKSGGDGPRARPGGIAAAA